MNDLLDAYKYDCLDCGDNTFFKNEYYMIHDEIWDSVAGEGMLCVQCLENRLGRILAPDDFVLYPINYGAFPQSPILSSRVYGD